MGHFLTWLARDLTEHDSFPLKTCAEIAYSRIRGVACAIKPQKHLNPKFWIKENINDKTGKTISHIETQCGTYGYDGEINYSDFNNLTEYDLPNT